MYVPFISTPSSRRLFKRKGGGGGGGGKGGGSVGKSSSGSSGKSSGSSSSGKSSSSGTSGSGSTSRTGSISSGKTTTYGSSYTTPRVIPAGQPFAGRSEGGSDRSQIFGTRTYGSGYPGAVGRGVSSRGLPFFYWPVVWPFVIGSATGSLYLHSENEYGSPTNSSRPGGALAYATFPSSSNSAVFRVLSDNTTVISLISDLAANCTRYLSNSTAPPNALSKTSTPYTSPYTFSNTTGPANPQPEQVIQYYRASTIALTLDSYNNTATSSADGTPDTPLPVLGTNDTALLVCLNSTIGLAAPLVSSGRSTVNTDIPLPTFFLLSLVWWLWTLL